MPKLNKEKYHHTTHNEKRRLPETALPTYSYPRAPSLSAPHVVIRRSIAPTASQLAGAVARPSTASLRIDSGSQNSSRAAEAAARGGRSSIGWRAALRLGLGEGRLCCLLDGGWVDIWWLRALGEEACASLLSRWGGNILGGLKRLDGAFFAARLTRLDWGGGGNERWKNRQRFMFTVT
jgi:hypothetical protein